MRVVVLDTGLNKDKISRDQMQNCTCYVYRERKWQIDYSSNTDNRYEHGTKVSQIILDNTQNIELLVFKVFEDTLTTCENIIYSALTYINESIPCDIINMSFGMRSYSKSLEIICKKIVDSGVTLVAAFDNGGAVSYPAGFPFVIGVVGSARCTRADDFVIVHNSLIDFKSKIGKPEAVANENTLLHLSLGNSMAAPYITSIIVNHKLTNKSVEEIKEQLKPLAKYIYDFPKRLLDKNKNIQIKNAAVFPFNKEIHSLVNFDQLLQFELMNVYDIKYSGNVGTQFKSMSHNSYVIKDYKHIDWNSFDTLIIGHVEELGILCQTDLKKELLESCLKHRKNAFCLDKKGIDEYRTLYNKNRLELWCAEDDVTDKPNNFGMLYQHKTPVLMIAGTSSKQGKFTLQLEIRKLLKNINVDVGQLGTEPNARLFGMSSALPYGYLSAKSLMDPQTILEIANEKLADIDKENHDIIILGMQSGLFPLHYYNSGQIEMRQFPMLFASIPDGVILCVNIQDDLRFIKRIINTLEALVCTKVFLIGLYAFHTAYDRVINVKKTLLTQEQVAQYKLKVSKELGLPVIVTGEPNDEEVLLNTIVTYFNGERL